MMGNLLDHPELLTQYKQNALLVADAAVRQGNWDMVGQLQAAYAQLYSANVLPQLTGPDLVQSYRYAKLRRLGAGARGIRYFDAELRMAAQDLPAADIHAADMWAQDTYQRYFFGKPGNNRVRSGYVCEDPNS